MTLPYINNKSIKDSLSSTELILLIFMGECSWSKVFNSVNSSTSSIEYRLFIIASLNVSFFISNSRFILSFSISSNISIFSKIVEVISSFKLFNSFEQSGIIPE